MDQILKLDNVDQYNSLYGLETLHPLVSVVNLTKATNMVNHIQMNYGLYALFLKQTKSCNIKYGRTSYDYEEGTIVCFAPGQTAGVDTIEDEIAPQVYGIVFHPDLIHGTALGKSIKNYTFFSYAVTSCQRFSFLLPSMLVCASSSTITTSGWIFRIACKSISSTSFPL